MVRPKAEPPVGRVKRQVTFNLPVDLVEEMRNAAIYFSGPPHRTSLASIAEQAIRRELDRMTKRLNGGDPIPQQEDVALRPGRPIGTRRKR